VIQNTFNKDKQHLRSFVEPITAPRDVCCDDSGRKLVKYIIGNHAGNELNLSQQFNMAASKSTAMMPSWLSDVTCLTRRNF